MPTKSLTKREEQELTIDQLELVKRTVAKGATDDELKLFLYQASRSGLDPLSKQIYFVKRGGQGTIQTAIDGFRAIASRTGEHMGTDDAVFKDEGGKPVAATVTVYRLVKGQRCAFTATAYYDEYVQHSGPMWQKMPRTMLSKCAESLALRKAFPADLSGLYTTDEMAQAETSAVDAVKIEAKVVPQASEEDEMRQTIIKLVKTFGFDPKSKDDWEAAVFTLTQLKLEPNNFLPIIKILERLTTEKVA